MTWLVSSSFVVDPSSVHQPPKLLASMLGMLDHPVDRFLYYDTSLDLDQDHNVN
jgi:hypothetical protein